MFKPGISGNPNGHLKAAKADAFSCSLHHRWPRSPGPHRDLFRLLLLLLIPRHSRTQLSQDADRLSYVLPHKNLTMIINDKLHPGLTLIHSA